MQKMCWLSKNSASGEKILHLQTAPNQPWRPYTSFLEYAVSDYRIRGLSSKRDENNAKDESLARQAFQVW